MGEIALHVDHLRLRSAAEIVGKTPGDKPIYADVEGGKYGNDEENGKNLFGELHFYHSSFPMK